MEENAKMITVLGVVSYIEPNCFTGKMDHFLVVKSHCMLITNTDVVLRDIFDTIGLASANELLDHLQQVAPFRPFQYCPKKYPCEGITIFDSD